MKVRSRHSSRDEKQKRIARVLFIAVACLVVGIFVPKFFSMLGRVVLYPVHATRVWFQESSARLPLYLKSHDELITRISELEHELSVAAGTELTERRLYEENVWLRGLLSVDGTPRIAAAVIARPSELPYDLLQIDRGEQDGIKVGAPVYLGADNVIGVITNTTDRYSFVTLFTSPGFTATAYIGGANIVATLEGYGGGVARVRVPQGVVLSVGNLVHLPSIDPGVFGRVEYLENRPSQPEQFGYITLKKPIAGLHYVAVGTEVVTPVPAPVIDERIAAIIQEAVVIDTGSLNLASTTISTSSQTTDIQS